MKVVVFQPSLPSYRVPFFDALGTRVELTVVAGDPFSDSSLRTSTAAQSFRLVQVRRFGAERLYIQPSQMSGLARSADVLILSWAPRCLDLLPAILAARLAKQAVILWGHGYGTSDSHLRRIVHDVAGHISDAVIVYGSSGYCSLTARGLDPAKVFVARNAIDYTEIDEAVAAWSSDDKIRAFQRNHGIIGRPLFLFCSRLLRANKIDMVLHALSLVVRSDPSARLAIIGEGPDADRLRRLSMDLSLDQNVLWLGAIYEEKSLAPWFLSSCSLVYPANAGLSLLHAMRYGLPPITCSNYFHNPEIENVIHGVNGSHLRCESVEELAAEMVRLSTDSSSRQKLRGGALESTRAVTVGRMVESFLACCAFASGRSN